MWAIWSLADLPSGHRLVPGPDTLKPLLTLSPNSTMLWAFPCLQRVIALAELCWLLIKLSWCVSCFTFSVWRPVCETLIPGWDSNGRNGYAARCCGLRRNIWVHRLCSAPQVILQVNCLIPLSDDWIFAFQDTWIFLMRSQLACESQMGWSFSLMLLRG